MDVASHNPTARRFLHLFCPNARILVPLMADRLSKLAESHSSDHVLGEHIFSSSILTIYDHRLIVATLAVRRILGAIRIHNRLFISDAKCEIQPMIETNNINISIRPPNYR